MEKNEKDLRSLCERFGNDGQTLLAFYAIGERIGGYYAIGEIFRLANGITAVLEKGLNVDATDDEEAIAFSVIEGIKGLLFKRGLEAEVFLSILKDIMEEIQNTKHSFRPDDKECIECDHYGECLMSHSECDTKCN